MEMVMVMEMGMVTGIWTATMVMGMVMVITYINKRNGLICTTIKLNGISAG